MTSDPLPELFALTVEPQAVRAGEVVQATFRTRNVGAEPSPAGVVRFALDEGLSALGATDVAVEPVAPGDDVVAHVHARAPATCEDATALGVRAVFALPNASYAANACTVVVRSRAILDGAATGVSVEPVDAETVRARAVVVNEGDGPVHDVLVTVPAPHGTVPLDDAATPVLHVARWEPGERREIAFVARIVAPVGEIRCDAARVSAANGVTTPIAVRGGVVVAPAVAPPAVDVTATRRRLDVSIQLRNLGWAPARDVSVEVSHPAGLALVAGSTVVDGTPAVASAARKAATAPAARIVRAAGRCVIVVALVAPRAEVRVGLSFATAAPLDPGALDVSVGEHRVHVPFTVAHTRDVRLHLVAVAVPPDGSPARVSLVAENRGDETAALHVVAEAARDQLPPPDRARAVAPCSIAPFEVEVGVPRDAPDGAVIDGTIVAHDDAGERARIVVPICVRRHVRTCVPVAAPACGDGAPAAPRVDVALESPARVTAQAPFAVRAVLGVHDGVRRLVLRAPPPRGARAVAGSYRVNGCAVFEPAAGDGVGAFGDGGVVLHGVPAGTRLELEWSLTADDDGAGGGIVLHALADADGTETAAAPREVVVEPRPLFAVRPATVAFHVTGRAVAAAPADAPAAAAAATPAREVVPAFAPEPSAAPPAHPAPAAIAVRLGAERRDACARLHHTLRGRGLVAHLFALRLFFPEDPPHEPHRALARAHDALCDVFDRLSVKLRIPGFDVCTDDLDDPALRLALDELCRQDGVPSPLAGGGSCGTPAALRTLVRVLDVPCPDDPPLGEAIAAHAHALDDALRRYEGLPLEIFDDALARGSDPALDDARDALLRALRPYVGAAYARC